jgi:RNA polymerase sigma factor (TIGR02999 family)
VLALPAHPPAVTPAIHSTVTRLLEELQHGNRAALDELFPLVYHELRRLAHRHRRRWDGDETLGTTALVHEAYLKLVGGQRLAASNRAHFLAVAAKAMRQVLGDYARAGRRLKRGGDLRRVSLEVLEAEPGQLVVSEEQAETLTALDAALDRLEQEDSRLSQVVECRFFAGLSIADTAAVVGSSPATVKRDWTLARAWLYREMQRHAEP